MTVGARAVTGFIIVTILFLLPFPIPFIPDIGLAPLAFGLTLLGLIAFAWLLHTARWKRPRMASGARAVAGFIVITMLLPFLYFVLLSFFPYRNPPYPNTPMVVDYLYDYELEVLIVMPLLGLLAFAWLLHSARWKGIVGRVVDFGAWFEETGVMVWSFHLVRDGFEPNDNHAMVPVQMRVQSVEGFIHEGDEIQLDSELTDGQLAKPNKVLDLTTGVTVEVTR